MLIEICDIRATVEYNIDGKGLREERGCYCLVSFGFKIWLNQLEFDLKPHLILAMSVRPSKTTQTTDILHKTRQTLNY